MTIDAFKIYVEQLRDGHTEEISEEITPQFLDVREKDLEFPYPVCINGQAYLAENSLVLHLDLNTIAKIPCSICNESVEVTIELKDSYHVIPLSEIKSGIFNFQDIARQNILLETPRFAECQQGHCPKREELKKYLKSPEEDNSSDEEGYHPFADLDLK